MKEIHLVPISKLAAIRYYSLLIFFGFVLIFAGAIILIAVFTDNRPDLLEASFACFCIGLVIIVIDFALALNIIREDSVSITEDGFHFINIVKNRAMHLPWNQIDNIYIDNLSSNIYIDPDKNVDCSSFGTFCSKCDLYGVSKSMIVLYLNRFRMMNEGRYITDAKQMKERIEELYSELTGKEFNFRGVYPRHNTN